MNPLHTQSTQPFEPPVLRQVLVATRPRAIRRHLPVLLLALILAVGAAFAAYTLLNGRDEKTERKLIALRHGPVNSTLHETGTIEALLEVPVLGRFQGEISWKTDDGKSVEAGEPLVRFDTKTVEDDIENKEKDLIDKEEAVRRAKVEIEYTHEKYQYTIRKQEVLLALAELERKNTLEMPTPEDKLDAQLAVKSAELDMQKAKVDYEANQELLDHGFASQSAVKALLLDYVTKKADWSKAKLVFDLTAAGATPDQKQIVEMAVADAKKRLKIARFDQVADMNECQATLELAEIDLANFKRQIAQAKQTLDWGTVRAPFKGNVVFNDVWKGSSKSRSPIQIGETRSAGSDLCTLCDTSNFRIRLWVNESDIKNVAVGQHAAVRMPALPGKVFDAVVTRLGVVAQDKNVALSSLALRKSGQAFVNVVQAHLDFVGLSDEDRKAIRIGFTADVKLHTGEKNDALLLPWAAIGYDQEGQPYAEVFADGGQPERRPLKLGRGESDAVEVLEGLSGSEQILDQSGGS